MRRVLQEASFVLPNNSNERRDLVFLYFSSYNKVFQKVGRSRSGGVSDKTEHALNTCACLYICTMCLRALLCPRNVPNADDTCASFYLRCSNRLRIGNDMQTTHMGSTSTRAAASSRRTKPLQIRPFALSAMRPPLPLQRPRHCWSAAAVIRNSCHGYL